MKLLVCAAAYPPEVGGVQTLSARLAGALAGRGHSVRVLARGAGETGGEGDKQGPEVSRVGWKPLLWPKFFGQVLGNRPEVILLTHRADFLRPALAARRMGIPLAVIAHGNEYYGSPRQGELIAALSRADVVIAVSRYALERLRGMGLRAKRTVAIPNGVGLEAFGPAGEGEIVRRRLGLEGKKVILSVGRLEAVKGFDAVIRALPRIAEEAPEAAYLIVGAGPEEAALRALAKEVGAGDRVIFAGEVPEIGRGESAYYQACDVFAMPSREVAATGQAEAFGIAYLEAGACGKPVVGGRSGGSPEAVADGESGLLVDPDQAGSVAEAILRLLASPDLARSMGEAGRKRAEARRWENVAAEYEAVLKEVAGSA